MPYNPNELNQQAEDTDPSQFDGIEATIVSIEEKTASDIFGEKTYSDPDKEMIEVTAEAPGDNQVKEVFALPVDDMSWVNPTFKLNRYKKKYNKMPEVDDTVTLTVNDSGFLAIELADV